MAEEHYLRVGIDGTGSAEGSRTVVRSLADIMNSATRTTSSVRVAESALGALGGTAGLVAKALGVLGISFSAAVIVSEVRKALNIIDQFKISVIQTAASLASFQYNKGGNIAETFRKSKEYASALAYEMERIDARSFANAQTLKIIANQYLIQRQAILDITNPQQIKGFEAIANAVMTIANGNSMQVFTEARALFEGTSRPGSTLANQVEGMIKAEGHYKSLKEAMTAWGQEGKNVLVELGKRLQGFAMAGDDIAKTITALGSSWQTIQSKILRGGLSGLFEDLVSAGTKFNSLMRENADEIATKINKAYLATKGILISIGNLLEPIISGLNMGIQAVLDTIQGIPSSLTGVSQQSATIGQFVSKIVEGWGMIAAVVLPVVTSKFKNIIEILSGMVNFGYLLGKILVDGVMAAIKAVGGLGEALMKVMKGDFSGAKKTLQDTFSGHLMDPLKDDMTVFKGIVLSVKENTKDLFNLDQFDQLYAKWTSKIQSPGPIPPPKLPGAGQDDEYLKKLEKTEKARLELIQAEHDRELNLQKNSLSQEEYLNEIAYKTGLESLREYLDAKNRIAKDNLSIQEQIAKEQLSVAEQAVEQLRKRVKPGEKDAEMYKALADVQNAQKALDDVQAKQAMLKIQTPQQDAAAIQAQAEQYANVAIQVAQLSGNLADAVEIKQKLDESNQNSFFSQVKTQAELGNAEAQKLLATMERLNEFNVTKAKIDQGDSLGKAQLDIIVDPYEKQLKSAEQAHNKIMAMKEAEMKLLEGNAKAQEDKAKEIATIEMAYAEQSHRLKLQLWGSQAAFYGGMLNQIAGLIDQSSKSGFEASKAFAIAATVVNTAAAIMNQLATIPGPAGWAAAAVAAATGVAQLANIMSTSYGGTGSISTPGNFSGSSSDNSGGIGTVLGDENAHTKSLSNSNDLLEKINTEQYVELKAIKAELQKMNYNLTGLASTLVRASGAFDEKSLNLNLPPTKLTFDITSVVGSFIQPFEAVFANRMIGLVNKTLGPIGSILGSLVSGAGSLLSSAISWIAGGLFGKTKVSELAAGIEINKTSISDILNGQGVNARQYVDIQTKKSSWFKTSKSTSTQYQALSADAQDMLNDMFKGLSNTLVELAKGLGTNVQDVLKYSFDIGKIDLKGMTGDQIAQKMAEVFSYAGDKAAQSLFGSILTAYQQIDEGPLETIVRVMTDKFVVLDSLAKTSTTATGDIIGLSESLIGMAGGLEDFMNLVDKYYQAFTTNAKKQVDLYKQLQVGLGTVNLTLPQTRQGFENLLSSIHLNQTQIQDLQMPENFAGSLTDWLKSLGTSIDRYIASASQDEKNQQRYIELLQLADAADQYYSALEEGQKAFHDAFDDQVQSLMKIRSNLTDSMYENIGVNFSSKILSSKEYFETYYNLISSLGNEFAIGMTSILNDAMSDIGNYFSTIDSMRKKYEELFYSEGEREAKAHLDLVSALSKVNLTLPTTREGYRQLVDAMNTNTDAGMKQYLTLLDLAQAADAYYTTLGQATKSYKDMVLDAIDIQMAATQAIQSIQMGNLSTLSPEEQYLQLKKQFVSESQSALSGDQEALKAIPNLVTQFLTTSKSYLGSSAAYTADYNTAMGILTAISGLDTSAASQMDLIQRQLDKLGALKDAVNNGNMEQVALLSAQVDLTRETNSLLRSLFAEGNLAIPQNLTLTTDNSGMEERLDKLSQQLAEMNDQLATLANNARLVSNE